MYIPQLRMKLMRTGEWMETLKNSGFDIYRGKYRPGFNPGTQDEFPPEYRSLLGLLQEISDEGITVKSLEERLIDFPALRANGEEVFLCWRADEDDIEFWHSIEDGFAGRRRITKF